MRYTASMRRLCLPVVLGMAVAIAGWPSGASAAPSSFTIRTSDSYIVKIGSLSIRGVNGGTLAAATRAFGRPSRIDPVGDGSDACRVTWRRLRIKALFANFGLDSACSPQGGRFQAATIRSPRFRTSRGVRVGSSSSSIPLKHTGAEFVSGAWWIATIAFLGDEENRTPTIKAQVANGKVTALSLFVGAAGD